MLRSVHLSVLSALLEPLCKSIEIRGVRNVWIWCLLLCFTASKHKPQCLLDGFIKSGKSATLAMLVHWARMQGWLVFYVPCGRDWTSGGMYYKNEQTGLYDTPVQAKTALEVRHLSLRRRTCSFLIMRLRLRTLNWWIWPVFMEP